jgi:cytochrome oxidase Cu insertion factor (SCO1/SenC/PrrC family)
MSEPAAWLAASLTDVRTGSAFKLADFKGKVVVVENFAVWCSTCLTQQKEVKKLKDQLGQRMDVVFVNLGIDSNEDAAKVKAYIEKNGFDWNYAVAPAAVAREMAKLFGDQFLNPPSAPMLILDKMGVGHPLPFGVKSAADLKTALDKYLQ